MDKELLAKLSALYIGASCTEFDTQSALSEPAAGGEDGVPEASHWPSARQTARASSCPCAACQKHVRFFDTARVPTVTNTCRDCKIYFAHAWLMTRFPLPSTVVSPSSLAAYGFSWPWVGPGFRNFPISFPRSLMKSLLWTARFCHSISSRVWISQDSWSRANYKWDEETCSVHRTKLELRKLLLSIVYNL